MPENNIGFYNIGFLQRRHIIGSLLDCCCVSKWNGNWKI